MFYVKQKALFPTPWPKIMSGEILAKEAAEERIWAEQTPRRCSGPRTLRTMCSVKIDFPIWEKCMPDVKLTETLQMTLKRDIIVVRTSRFWYDNGML